MGPPPKDDWVFDTVKPATYRQPLPQSAQQTTKRRKMSKVSSDDDTENATNMMQSMDINSAPLVADRYTNSSDRSSTIRTPKPRARSPVHDRKDSALTSRKVSVSNPPVSRNMSRQNSTARKTSGQKQPLGLDMSFGNGTSTVRQFRRVSSSSGGQQSRRASQADASESLSEDSQRDVSDSENQHPSAPAVIIGTKEAVLGRRAYAKSIDPALQAAYASTTPGPKQAALAKLAEAWSVLDEVDPEGELLLLKSLFDRLQADPKLAAHVMPAQIATTQLASLRLCAPTKREAIVQEKEIIPTPPLPSKRESTPKLAVTAQNQHLRTILRDASATAFAAERVKEKERTRRASMVDNFPGRGEPGLAHVGMLADALYGRWSDGLRTRWPMT